jgi:hypothetical protein
VEPNFKTSFIPKKPIVAERVKKPFSIGIFSVLAFFVLLTVLLVTGGLYLYKVSLNKSIADKVNQLNIAKNRFEPSEIIQLQLLDKRLNAATEILANHISVTPIFQALEAITMKSVRFTDFSYELASGNNAKGHVVNVKMAGLAVGYRSIALQSDLFTTKEEAKHFIEPIFSNLTLDDKGNVKFDLEFSVDPAFVDYKSTLPVEETPV